MRRGAGGALFTAALMLLTVRTGSAQTVAADCAATEDPAVLFKKGKEYFASEDYQRSYYCYNKSWRIRPAFDVAGNLGNLEVKHLRRYADGATHLEYARQNLPGSLDAEKRREVLATIEELLAIAIERVSTTKFEIQPNGAEVRVDGRFVGRAPLRKALYLDPGHHKVEARLPGYVHQAREIACRAGTTQEVRITLAQERRAKDTEGGGDPRLPVAITAMALGAVAVAAGVGLVVAAQSRSDGVAILQEEITSDPAAPTENPCSSGPSRHPKCDELQDAADQELAFQWGGVAALIGGGALLLGGTLYLVIPLSIADTRETATIVIEPNSVLVRGRF